MTSQCATSLVKRHDVAFARIWLLNEPENILELVASAGMYTHLDGPHSRVPVGKLKIGLIAQERKPHLTNSVLGDPRVGDQEWARREGMVAFAGYPLICKERLLGVVAVFSRNPFSVTDTGTGIPEDRRDRLFLPFSQVDSSTSRHFGGTGLGLSICKQLVELMGGRIGVDSQIGIGTIFWFEIPLLLADGDADAVAMAQKQVFSGVRVMVVYGIDKERQQIGLCLRAWGCHLQTVASIPKGLEAIDRAKLDGVPYSIVLVDCRMAKGDEYVLLSQLAEHRQLAIIGLGVQGHIVLFRS